MTLFEEIKQGMTGDNWGYDNGIPKLMGVTGGNIRENYTVIFSNTGGGKTSFYLYSYIYKPIMESISNGDNNFKTLCFSLEMSKNKLLCKLLSIYLFEKYNKVLSTSDIFSRHKGKILSEEDYKLITNDDCTNWLNEINKRLEIIDGSVNADTIYAILRNRLSKEGEFIKTKYGINYKPNNPKLIYNIVIDHISLISTTKGRSKKEEIDLASKYLLTLRNICKISPIVIMQTNRDFSSTDRKKLGENNYDFQITDIKDSGSPSEDAETVISLFNPYSSKMKSFDNYDMTQLKNNFRSITIHKSRFGEANVKVYVSFYGEIGLFKEIPKASDIEDYSPYVDVRLIETNSKETEDNKINNDFKFII